MINKRIRDFSGLIGHLNNENQWFGLTNFISQWLVMMEGSVYQTKYAFCLTDHLLLWLNAIPNTAKNNFIFRRMSISAILGHLRPSLREDFKSRVWLLVCSKSKSWLYQMILNLHRKLFRGKKMSFTIWINWKTTFSEMPLNCDKL